MTQYVFSISGFEHTQISTTSLSSVLPEHRVVQGTLLIAGGNVKHVGIDLKWYTGNTVILSFFSLPFLLVSIHPYTRPCFPQQRNLPASFWGWDDRRCKPPACTTNGPTPACHKKLSNYISHTITNTIQYMQIHNHYSFLNTHTCPQLPWRALNGFPIAFQCLLGEDTVSPGRRVGQLASGMHRQFSQ